ncbi:Lipopolysaccharide-assembly [bacterium A37T11]|nr:Lipopolysaccharide-assembly [bacterium A37T11]
MKQLRPPLLIGILCLLVCSSCKVKYSLSGGSIPEGMKTMAVLFFENTAPQVVPTLSNEFTEALKERIRSQSGLSMVTSDADGIMEGRITGYSITSSAVEGNNRAALNKLTITVNVKYTNNVKTDDSFEQSFSRFVEFSGQIQSQESELIRQINQMLTEDIYNRAFANW